MNIHSLLRTVGRLSCGIAPAALLCALPIHAQQPLPASPAAAAVAPAAEQIPLKNDRLFFVLADYTFVEKQDKFAPLSAKTKFLLSTKTMSDPVTVSVIGAIALICGESHSSK